MTLNRFNGGLVTNISPHLINLDQSTVCNNVNINSLGIKPLAGNTATVENFGSDGAFTRFKGQWFSSNLGTSYVRFNDVLYYSTGSGELKKSVTGLTTHNVGLDKPSAALVVSTDEITFTLTGTTGGDLTAATYYYKIVYEDTEGNAKTVSKDLAISGVNNAVNIVVNSTTNILNYSVYRLVGSSYKYVDTTDSTTITDDVLDLGTASTLSAFGTGDAIPTRQYVYTYYVSVDGTESAPCPISDEIDVLSGSVTLSGFATSSDTRVDLYRIYRLGGDLVAYSLVEEVATGTTTYVDTKTDVEIAGNDSLTTEGTIKPPEDLNYLTLSNSVLFGAKDATLWFSESGLVDRWNAFNYINLPENITGLGVTQNGLLIFSRNTTYILTGSDVSTYSLQLLHGSQGCVSHNTIGYVKNQIFWYGLDGICTSNGSDIEVITEQALGKLDLNPITAEVYEGQYYLFHGTGTLITDLRYGSMSFRTMDLIVNGAYYNPDFDKLYFINPSDFGMYEFATDTNVTIPYSYKTGYLSDNGLTNIKIYKDLYIFVNGTTTMKVYLDGILVNTYSLINGTNEIKTPAASMRGYYLELEFTGTGEILEVEFKTMGRQNGR